MDGVPVQAKIGQCGVKETERALRELGHRVATRLGENAVRAGGTPTLTSIAANRAGGTLTLTSVAANRAGGTLGATVPASKTIAAAVARTGLSGSATTRVSGVGIWRRPKAVLQIEADRSRDQAGDQHCDSHRLPN